MPNRHLLVATAAMMIGTAACDRPSVDHAAEAEALMALSRQWSEIVEGGDYEGAMRFWADDAVMLPPDFPILDGKAAIREYVAGAADIPGFKISWEPREAHISDSGDMAYLIETNVIEVDGPDGKRTVSFSKAIIAAGSSVVRLPFIPYEDARIIDSTS